MIFYPFKKIIEVSLLKENPFLVVALVVKMIYLTFLENHLDNCISDQNLRAIDRDPINFQDPNIHPVKVL